MRFCFARWSVGLSAYDQCSVLSGVRLPRAGLKKDTSTMEDSPRGQSGRPAGRMSDSGAMEPSRAGPGPLSSRRRRPMECGEAGRPGMGPAGSRNRMWHQWPDRFTRRPTSLFSGRRRRLETQETPARDSGDKDGGLRRQGRRTQETPAGDPGDKDGGLTRR